MGRKPYYAVANGRTIGVFTSWEDCKASVDKFPGSQFKGFNSQAEAMSYIAGKTLMKKQKQESERPKQRDIPGVPLQQTSKTWGAYEEEQERRYQALGARKPKKAGARIDSYFDTVVKEVEIVDVEGEENFGDNGSSPSPALYIDDRPTQVVQNTAKRPSPAYPDVSRKKAKTTEREVIDLTDSPPKNRSSYDAPEVYEIARSSVSGRMSPPQEYYFSQGELYSIPGPIPQHFDNKRNDVPQTTSVQQRHSCLLSPTSSDEPSSLLQSNRQSSRQPIPQHQNTKYSTHKEIESPYTDKPISSVPFTAADCSPHQKHILDLVTLGKNVFFTGSAGVGKSFVLNKICEQLKFQGMKQFSDFFMTASTGIAAVQIGGMTLHSFAGTGKGEDGIIQLKKMCAGNKRVRKHWKSCKVLIIDEVSMLSDEFFDKLDQIGRHVREDDRPFGGIQLVLCGDFYQLPPVAGNEKRRCPNCGSFNSKVVGTNLECLGKVDPGNQYSVPCQHVFPKKIGYIFQSAAWKAAHFNIIELTKIYRQSDSTFVTALNKARLGKVDAETLRLFNSCQRPLEHDESIKPTKIYPIKVLVQDENTREFEALETPIHIYSAVDNQVSPPEYPQDMTHLLNDLQATKGLRLRAGAQVMLLANLDVTQGLVNGSRGVVVEFVSMEEAIQAVRIQSALRGSTQDNESKAIGDLITFAGKNDKMQFPKVLFELKKGTKEIIITPYTWTMQLGHQIEVSRVQIPLMTAWALTIHKCQGMTLERCVLYLDRCFGFGMAYVALSRCKSLEGLQIVGWKGGNEIRADPVVEKFYKSIQAQTLI